MLFDLEGRTLRFEGKKIAFPAGAEEALGFLAEAEEPFAAAEIPGELDDASRFVLVRRLVREGFLRLSEPAPNNGADAGE